MITSMTRSRSASFTSFSRSSTHRTSRRWSLPRPSSRPRRKAVREKLAVIETELLPQESRVFGSLTDDEREKHHEVIAAHVLGLDQRSDQQKQAVLKFIAARNPSLQPKVTAYNKLKASERKAVSDHGVGGRKEPRPTHVHIGGDFTRHGPLVSPDVPAVFFSLTLGGRGGYQPRIGTKKTSGWPTAACPIGWTSLIGWSAATIRSPHE